MFVKSLFTHYYAPNSGADGGGDDDAERVRSEDVINRAKDDKDAIARLGRELDKNEDRRFHLRDDRRLLRDENTALKAAQPADGALLLSKEDAAKWQAYVGLGDPKDLQGLKDTSTTTAAELATLKRDAQLRDVANAYGYAPAALNKLPSLKDKTFEVKQEQIDGKDVTRAYVDGKELSAYVTEHDPEFLGALRVDGQQQAQPARQPFPAQSAGGKPAGTHEDAVRQSESTLAQTGRYGGF